MRSNLGPTHGTGVRWDDAASEFDAFDALPPVLRGMLNEAPVKISAVSVTEAQLAAGTDWARQGIALVAQQECPGWRPIVTRRLPRRRRPATL